MPTYNYVITSLIRRLDLAAMYICKCQSVLVFSYLHLPPCQPKPPLSHPSLSKGVQNFHLQIPKRKEEKRKERKMYRIVSCRVANARVGYRIKCLSKV